MGDVSHVYAIERLISPAQRSRIDIVELTTTFTHEIVGWAILDADCDWYRQYFDFNWWLFKPLPALKRVEATYEISSTAQPSSADSAKEAFLTLFNASILVLKVV